MKQEIKKLKDSVLSELDKTKSKTEFQRLYYQFLGRKGKVSELLKSIPELPLNERPEAGRLCNILKKEIEEIFNKKRLEIEKKELKVSKVDITLSERKYDIGYSHPISITMKEILASFKRLGFHIAEGPEIETDYYNFTALNFPVWHPARDMQATFFLQDGRLLRTHTSPVQIRIMESYKPPICVVVPGRVFRSDKPDATHYPIFHQVEGLFVDKDVSMPDLKGMLLYFARDIFEEKVQIRFRPSFFPFTEPSVEVDISCIFCGNKGCGMCKQTGWIEILGAGMVHPAVIKNVGYDNRIYNGFAFGLGVERVTMLKYRIDDIRLFYENHLEFLNQFKKVTF
ncbi:MAG: phenylalanine--tRNA ligase subunit alpha [Candidatus Hydrogenedentota bacterium]